MLIACGNSDNDEGNALSHMNNDIDIYSNSWGPSDNGNTLSGPGPLMIAAFEDDAYNGRNGLGNVITWAAGNGFPMKTIQTSMVMQKPFYNFCNRC